MTKNKKTTARNNNISSAPQQNNKPHSIYQSVSFSSPLPPPGMLEKYDEKFPGTAERIIQILETQGKHRQYMEKTSLDANISHLKNRDNEAKRGQYLGFILGVVGIICATISALQGAQIFGSLIGVGSLSSIVIAFIKGRDTEKK